MAYTRKKCDELLNRIDQLSSESKALWGIGIYKHTDHHLQQFGV